MHLFYFSLCMVFGGRGGGGEIQSTSVFDLTQPLPNIQINQIISKLKSFRE